MKWNDRLWQQSQQYFAQFLIPLVEVLGRSERRVAATRYIERALAARPAQIHRPDVGAAGGWFPELAAICQ
jgi:hypothetical protein